MDVSIPVLVNVECYNSGNVPIVPLVERLSNNRFVSVFPYDSSHTYTCQVKAISMLQNSTIAIKSTSVSLFQLRTEAGVLSTCLQWTVCTCTQLPTYLFPIIDWYRGVHHYIHQRGSDRCYQTVV